MNLERIFQVSFDSLVAHRLRTSLTMLGVIFGVGAVIAMLSIGEGAKREALEQISILGINNRRVFNPRGQCRAAAIRGGDDDLPWLGTGGRTSGGDPAAIYRVIIG